VCLSELKDWCGRTGSWRSRGCWPRAGRSGRFDWELDWTSARCAWRWRCRRWRCLFLFGIDELGVNVEVWLVFLEIHMGNDDVASRSVSLMLEFFVESNVVYRRAAVQDW